MTTITVELGERSYPIHIGVDIQSQLAAELERLEAKGAVAICTDSNVGPLYADMIATYVRDAGCEPVVCTMESGEGHKRLERVEEFTGQFLEAGLDRGSVVVALGGGVLGDVAGYTAASFMRGIRFIQMPTTIVAQVDSSVGGKTGVNHPKAKNIIGAFHQPSAVITDMQCLRTLPERELRAGLAEVIKHGIIADEKLFAYMEANVERILNLELDAFEVPIRRSCEIKGAIVSADEREGGVRANLNYGHTFGHGIEAATNYQQFLHGEAIALGMVAAGALSKGLGLVDEAFCARQRACFDAYGLPVQFPDISVDEVMEAMQHDKKSRAGVLKFIAVEGMGKVVHRTDVTPDQARAALETLQ